MLKRITTLKRNAVIKCNFKNQSFWVQLLISKRTSKNDFRKNRKITFNLKLGKNVTLLVSIKISLSGNVPAKIEVRVRKSRNFG